MLRPAAAATESVVCSAGTPRSTPTALPVMSSSATLAVLLATSASGPPAPAAASSAAERLAIHNQSSLNACTEIQGARDLQYFRDSFCEEAVAELAVEMIIQKIHSESCIAI